MLTLHNITSRNVFISAKNNGKAVHGKAIIIVTLPNKDNIISTGITVSKKVGNAVKRNFVKRRLRHAIKNINWHNESLGKNFIFIAKPFAKEINFQQLCQELKNMLLRLN